MDGSSYYIPAVVMAAALVFKLPALARGWRDPLLRSVCALLALAAAVFAFAAPPTIAAVNRATGIPNVSAPLVYALLSAFSASCLVLIVYWRGGPPEQTRRVARRLIAGYGVVIVALIVLFVLGNAPVERLRDLDTYYANTPFIREMIVLYLVALTVAGVAMNVLCGRWALEVGGWLRAGLLVIVLGYLFNLAYCVTKFAAVAARWAGGDGDWDGLSTYVAPILASAAAQVSAIGFCLPLVGQRLSGIWKTWYAYHQLDPLWREVRTLGPRDARPVRLSLWPSAELRLTQRESAIHDGVLALIPYFDPGVRERAYEAARTARCDPAQARCIADAAMLAAAVRARSADPDGKIINLADEVPPTAAEAPYDLVGMSTALRQSPIVAAARRHAARSESDSHERTP
ncbi:MAB_1171c family putative transporter [Streptomyces sp. GC420]|uniref:MAB_1171c family putative transporter n=1 Tax=Streptomyces sp. GC420 TaxID=2697568 RepID=UPI001414D3C7|nr:MAB_1171c family putative transporter [Streptomyces sp. GC420]NBM16602.1 hypothetical protein [Streptomyces sp. GC420]